MDDPRRAIPSVEKLLSEHVLQQLLETEPRNRVVNVIRGLQHEVRLNGAPEHDTDWYVQQTVARLQKLRQPSLRRVINATGVVLHTNLGRAPLSEAALRAIQETAQDYSNLEYDLSAGARGSRYDHCTRLLCELTGADAALVVNNNAAALVLALHTFAARKHAVVSRGELVEIGGSFRIPEIMERSGARLREVGATNRTHLRDYESALDGEVGALLKVHRSNFEMSGFVSEVSVRDLVPLARAHSVPLLHDLGSGLIEDLSDVGLRGEPTAREALSAGADVITLSGDKLLGGPQAGILLGNAEYIRQLRDNPLCRALRVDKLTLAALEATLQAYAQGTARTELPTLRMLTMPADDIRVRAVALQQKLRENGIRADLVPGTSAVGGGAFPGSELPTFLLLTEASIGASEPRVIARTIEQRTAIDLRTVRPQDEAAIVAALTRA